MKKLSLVIALMGIFVLLYILNFSSPIQINSIEQLSPLQENQKVVISGKVISESQYENLKLLRLNNSPEVVCTSCPYYNGKNISVLGIVERYKNKTQIRVLRIIKNEQ